MNTEDHSAQAEQPPGPDDRPQPETSTAPSAAGDSPRVPWEKWGPHEKGPVEPPPEVDAYYPDDDADIRTRARAFRHLGIPRHEAFDTILRAGRAGGGRRPITLTDIEFKRIFDEEWPEP